MRCAGRRDRSSHPGRGNAGRETVVDIGDGDPRGAGVQHGQKGGQALESWLRIRLLVGTAKTGAPTSPPTTLGSAPSIPATTTSGRRFPDRVDLREDSMEARHPHVVDPVDRDVHGHADLHGLFSHGKIRRSSGNHGHIGRFVVRALFRWRVDQKGPARWLMRASGNLASRALICFGFKRVRRTGTPGAESRKAISRVSSLVFPSP